MRQRGMTVMNGSNGFMQIEWERLLNEYVSFSPDREFLDMECTPFARSLFRPVPPFVKVFIKIGASRHGKPVECIRSLYDFLLQKRYDEKLNLLYFAFRIFEDDTHLSTTVIDRTPFPHEDGVPRFGLIFGSDRRFLQPPQNRTLQKPGPTEGVPCSSSPIGPAFSGKEHGS